MKDIANASLSTQKARQERMMSLHNKKWDSFSAIAELASRKLKKLVIGKETQCQQTVGSRTA
jgi:hypothetical protein